MRVASRSLLVCVLVVVLAGSSLATGTLAAEPLGGEVSPGASPLGVLPT